MNLQLTGVVAEHSINGITALFFSNCHHPIAREFAKLDGQMACVSLTGTEYPKPIIDNMRGRVSAKFEISYDPEGNIDCEAQITVGDLDLLAELSKYKGLDVLSLSAKTAPTTKVCLIHPDRDEVLNSIEVIDATHVMLMDYIIRKGVAKSGANQLTFINAGFSLPTFSATNIVLLNGFPVAYVDHIDFESFTA